MAVPMPAGTDTAQAALNILKHSGTHSVVTIAPMRGALLPTFPTLEMRKLNTEGWGLIANIWSFVSA